MNILNINDSTVQNIFNKNKEYINMNIVGTLNLCYLKCSQSMELCEDLTIKRIINYNNCLILEFDKSQCYLDVKFNEMNNDGKFNFEKIIITLPSLHHISGTSEAMEIFMLFSSKSIPKDDNEPEDLYLLLSTLVTTTTNVVNDPFNKLMTQLFGDKSKLPKADPNDNIINFIKPSDSSVNQGLNQNISPIIDLESFIPNIGDRSFFDFANKNVHFRVFKSVKELSNITFANINNILKSINIEVNYPPAELSIYFHQDFDETDDKLVNIETISLSPEKDLELELKDKTVEKLVCNGPSLPIVPSPSTNPAKNKKNVPDCFYTFDDPDDEESGDYISGGTCSSSTTNTTSVNYKKETIYFNIGVSIAIILFVLICNPIYTLPLDSKKIINKGERTLCTNVKQLFCHNDKVKNVMNTYILVFLLTIIFTTYNIFLLKNIGSFQGLLIRSNIIYFIVIIYIAYRVIVYDWLLFFVTNPIFIWLSNWFKYVTCWVSNNVNNDNSTSGGAAATGATSATATTTATGATSATSASARNNTPIPLANESNPTNPTNPPIQIGGDLSNNDKKEISSFFKYLYLLAIVVLCTFAIVVSTKIIKPYKGYIRTNIIILFIIMIFTLVYKSAEMSHDMKGLFKSFYSINLSYLTRVIAPSTLLSKVLENTHNEIEKEGSNELNSEFGPYVLERVISDQNESDIIQNIITKTIKKKIK